MERVDWVDEKEENGEFELAERLVEEAVALIGRRQEDEFGWLGRVEKAHDLLVVFTGELQLGCRKVDRTTLERIAQLRSKVEQLRLRASEAIAVRLRVMQETPAFAYGASGKVLDVAASGSLGLVG